MTLSADREGFDSTMTKNKRATAVALAQAHFKVEPNLRHVILLEPVDEAGGDAPIALLEVVDGTIERGIEPIAFTADPARGIDYPSVIIEVSPREFDDIRSNKLDIRRSGWIMGQELKAS